MSRNLVKLLRRVTFDKSTRHISARLSYDNLLRFKGC